MKLIHRQTLAMLPGPFFGWLGTLMFLLVMQFLIRYLPDIAGKGLPLLVIVELVAYNLAYMVVLAVPMAVLLASLMTYGRLAESKAYAVLKSAGVSLPQLIWPSLILSIFVAAGMVYFNNEVLPEANFRARTLWQDIRQKKPGFDLRPGVFYNGLDGYSILVQEQDPQTGALADLTVYDYTEGTRRQTVVKADHGRIVAHPDGLRLDLILEEGEIHRPRPAEAAGLSDRYERLAFGRHRLTLDLEDFVFERSDPNDGYRSDRTMPTVEMLRMVDSLTTSIAAKEASIRSDLLSLGADSSLARRLADEPSSLPEPRAAADASVPVRHVALAGLDSTRRVEVVEHALQASRSSRAQIDQLVRTLQWESQRVDRYWVEIHKKFSIAVACLIFMLIGAPLGLSVRRGGLGVVGGLALGIFLFYWVTLVQGEKLADRGLLDPWVGMWIANIVMTAVGLWLVAYVTFDLRATWRWRQRS